MYSDGALCCFRVSWGIFRLRLVSHVAGTDIEYLLLLLSTGIFIHTFHQRLYLLIPHPTYIYVSYNMQRTKAGSLRMAAFLELGIDCAYTCEVSMAGTTECHFTAGNLYDFGRRLCHR